MPKYGLGKQTNPNHLAVMAINETLREYMTRLQLPDVTSYDWKQPVERLRERFYKASRAVESGIPELADISPMEIRGANGKLSARLYVPLGAGVGAGPGIVFFHGGGFVLGDLDSHDIICRRLADASRCRLIAVDYRKAPEHVFPAAHDDALAAWDWIIAHADMLGLDPKRIAVAGDSAGGNLAAFIAQEMVHVSGAIPAFQLLLYPLVQFADIRADQLSFKEGGFFISENLFRFFRDSYLNKESDRMDSRVSPLFADAVRFKGLPPAHIVLCGWDPLKHEGVAYADKMASYGVSVSLREHRDMVHGFMNMTGFSQKVRDAIRDAGQATGKALGALQGTQ